jgi:hypothetical protein
MLQTEKKQERWGLFANITGDRVLRDGAKVHIVSINGSGECWEVRGLSRGGRRVTKYVQLSRLINWRVGMIPPGEPITYYASDTKEAALKRWAWMFEDEGADTEDAESLSAS